MDDVKKKEVIKKVLNNNELYKLNGSRFKRFLKAPFKTLPFYILTFLAYRKPFKVKYKTFWGDTMKFYLPEGNAIYYYGFFEANLTNFLINFLKEGNIFFDIGANVGYYTLLASKLVGEIGQVYSFEPTPRTFNTLKQNSNIRNNIIVNNNAVLDEEKEIEFIDYGPKYSAFNSFHARTDESIKFRNHFINFFVKTISLDKYCKEKNIIPDFIKIDAEGAEYLILEAMKNILETKKSIISIEVAGGEEWKDNCQKSIRILQESGYIPYEIDLYGFLKPHKIQEKYSYDNLIFVHKDNTEKIHYLVK